MQGGAAEIRRLPVAGPTSAAARWIGLGALSAVGFGLGGAGFIAESLVPVVLGAVLFAIGVLFFLGSGWERHVRPGRELAWCSVALGVPFTLAFRTQTVRQHAIWVSFEIDWDLRPAPHGFVIELEIEGPFGLRRERCFQSFCQPPYVTGHAIEKSAVSTGFTAPPGLSAPLRAIDVNLDSRATGPVWRGRLRTHTCLVELAAMPPGTPLQVRGRIVPSADVEIHHFHAEAFVALPAA